MICTQIVLDEMDKDVNKKQSLPSWIWYSCGKYQEVKFCDESQEANRWNAGR